MTGFIIKIFFGLFVFYLSGRTTLEVFAGSMETSAKTAVSFMLGLGLVTLQMFLYSLAGLPFGPLPVALPWFVLCVPVFIISYRCRVRENETRWRGPGGRAGTAVTVLSIVIIASQVIYAFAYAPLLPITGWDSWSIWFLKGKAFFSDGAVRAGFLLDGDYSYSHTEYPLLVPLSITWMYTAVGGAHESAAKLLYPVQYICMLVIFHHSVRKCAGGRYSLPFTALLALTPLVMLHVAGITTRLSTLYTGDFVGYADFTLSVYFLAAAAFLLLYSKDKRRMDLVLSALFFAMGAWTKNEGLPFAFIGALLCLVSAFFADRRICAALGAFSGAFLALIVPWVLFKGFNNLKSEYANMIAFDVVIGNLGRIFTVLKRMAWHFFVNVEVFNFTWWAYAMSNVLNRHGFFRPPVIFLNLALFLQLCVYVFVYVITPVELNWHMGTSFDRLILHMVPLSMLITAVNFAAYFERNVNERAGLRPLTDSSSKNMK